MDEVARVQRAAEAGGPAAIGFLRDLIRHQATARRRCRPASPRPAAARLHRRTPPLPPRRGAAARGIRRRGRHGDRGAGSRARALARHRRRPQRDLLRPSGRRGLPARSMAGATIPWPARSTTAASMAGASRTTWPASPPWSRRCAVLPPAGYAEGRRDPGQHAVASAMRAACMRCCMAASRADAAVYLHPAESGIGMREVKALAAGPVDLPRSPSKAACPTRRSRATPPSRISR